MKLGSAQRLRRIAVAVTSFLFAGLVSSMPAVAYDQDAPIDDPYDGCYLYGAPGSDFSPGLYCEHDHDWVSNDVAFVEDQLNSPEPSPSPTQEPSPEPSPTPTETPRDKPGKGPK